MSTASGAPIAVPKHSSDGDHALVYPGDPAETAKSDNSDDAGLTAASATAALSRAIAGMLAFMFKRPVRLFRPVKISTMAGIQAIAEERGKAVTPAFVRGLIRNEGWRFFPKHILPPLTINAMIGLTLFGTYTTAESILSTRFESPAAIYVLGPFISGACAGAAQSLLSAPLDNARHLLLRRQRFLRQTAESLPSRRQRKRLVGSRSAGLPFTSWWSLLRDSVFNVTTGSPVRRHPSSGDASMAPTSRRERLERARSWARRGWSFLGLSVAKDSLAFGTFFVIFEVGREGARRVGLVWDNIDLSLDSDGASDRERQRRSASGLILQSLLILVSGGIAGWVFSLVARPFERVRAAVYEGRARWAHGQSSRTSTSPTPATASTSLSSGARRSLHPGRSKGGASERRSRAALETSGRKKSLVRVGHLRRISRRRPATSQHSNVRTSAGNTPSSSAEGVRPPVASSVHVSNEPAASMSAPTAKELVGKACRQYGAATFLFAPRSVLQAIEARQRLASALPDEGPTATLPPKRHVPGPTRLSARGRQATQSMTVSTSSRMLRVGGSILRFVPPYAIGFFAYAMVSGDLKIEV
ncbi:hypothetical protein JCM8202_000517 [Rhodotorula sphaerocarpa]